MKILHSIPESEMVATFLRAEYRSERFADELKGVMERLNLPESMIVTPNTQDETENELRDRLLGDYRGWKQNREIFTNFPEKMYWYRAELNRDEVLDLQYVDYSYWNELTDGSHLVRDAVDNIRNGKVVFKVSNEGFLALADYIHQGVEDLEPMILISRNQESPLTILEGHKRATAYGLAGGNAPEKLDVLVGYEVAVTTV